MRCDICGVPIGAEETRCKRCIQQRRERQRRQRSIQDQVENDDQREGEGTRTGILDRATIPAGPTSIILDEKYRLIDEIGRGAMGTVFLAEDFSLRRKVAVKFLLPEFARSVDCARRFEQEAVGMAAVRDNNVAQIYAFGEHNDVPYFVMEHLDGRTVEDIVEAHNRRGLFLPLNEALDILVQTASGLSAIHRAGVVHHDIKPANIMVVGVMNRVVIMDFGLVRDVTVEEEKQTMAGTPAYMAPELAEGDRGAARSLQTDIYSLGVTAYEVLTGGLPFPGDSWIEVLRKHITEVPPFPSERRPGIPAELDNVVFRALAKDRNERYSTAEELIEDLLRAAEIAFPSGSLRTLGGLFQSPLSRPPVNKARSISGGASRSTPSVHRGRLLVADADAGFRASVHEIAKAAVPGCRVHSASDGNMAIELVEQLEPDVLLLNLSLPEVNGFEVVATLRGESKFDGMSIIVAAERGGRHDIEILRKMRIHNFLVKPVDLQALADELRPLLEHPVSRVT